jgi:hypothetical protein
MNSRRLAASAAASLVLAFAMPAGAGGTIQAASATITLLRMKQLR